MSRDAFVRLAADLRSLAESMPSPSTRSKMHAAAESIEYQLRHGVLHNEDTFAKMFGAAPWGDYPGGEL